MIKAVLRYTDYMHDEKTVNYYLSNSSARIIKTSRRDSMYPKVTIVVDSVYGLKKIVSLLNDKSVYGVTIVKAREMIKIFGIYI